MKGRKFVGVGVSEATVGGFGFEEGVLVAVVDDGSEAWVDFPAPVDVGLHDLLGGDLPRADQSRKLATRSCEKRFHRKTPKEGRRTLERKKWVGWGLRIGIWGGVLVAGVIVLLIRFETPYRARILNLVGLNPTVAWVGLQAPDFRLKELRSGRWVEAKDLRGKVVLLDFWATWCSDCVKQMPLIHKLHKESEKTKAFQVWSVNIREAMSEPASAVRGFLQKYGYDFPVLLGDDALASLYKIRRIPTIVILTASGRVSYTGAEYHEEADLRSRLLEAAR